MKKLKIISLILVLLFIVIQLIRPSRNIAEKEPQSDITKVVVVPGEIKAILLDACYDCHSNNTRYPWYFNIQPVGWFLTSHINKAKRELNFNEFGSYAGRRQISKLDGIANSIRDNIMPLPSYRLMHKVARLSNDQKEKLINWAESVRDSLSMNK